MKNSSIIKPFYRPLSLIPDKLEITTQIISSSTCRPHIHAFYEIFYVISGNMKHSLNGEEIMLSTGDCVLLSPDDVHEFSPIGDSIHRDLLVSRSLFNCALSLAIQSGDKPENILGGAIQPVHFSSAEIIELESIAQKFTRENDTTKKRCIGVILLLNILLKYFRSNEYTDTVPRSLSEKIQDHLNKSDNIQGGIPSLSKQLKYSASYLCHTFKKETGTPLSHYIRNLRLNYIEYYIKTSNYSLQKIADLVGIESLPYLNKIFKEKYGIPPIKYRKQHGPVSDSPQLQSVTLVPTNELDDKKD